MWWWSLHNSMKLSQAMQDHLRQMCHSEEFWQNVVHWRREWQTTPIFLLWEPHEQYEKTRRYDTGRWVSQVKGVQYAPGEEQKAITNSFRKNEAAGPKPRWCSVVDVSGGESEVQCYKEQCCIEIWNVRSMNEGKLEVIKQEMSKGNMDILGISEQDFSEQEWTLTF